MGDRRPRAWGELPADEFAHVKHVARLVAVRRPVAAPSQVVRGDLTGNVPRPDAGDCFLEVGFRSKPPEALLEFLTRTT